MAEPLIKKAGFWADGINGLLLRKPYRTYSNKNAGTEEPEQDTRLEIPLTENGRVDYAALTRIVQEHEKEWVKRHPEEAERHKISDIEDALPDFEEGLDVETMTGILAELGLERTTRPRHSKPNIPAGSIRPFNGHHTALLWEHSTIQRRADVMPSMDALRAYIVAAIKPSSSFTTERLKAYDFGITDSAILASVVKGMDTQSIASTMSVAPEDVFGTLHRAYKTFGVTDPEGLQVALSYLGSVEAESIVHAIREALEVAFDSHTPEQQEQPTARHSSAGKYEEWHHHTNE